MWSETTLEVEMVPDSSPRGNYPAPSNSFALRLDDELALRLVELHHADEHFERLAAEREHLGRWFPWARDATPTSTSDRIRRSLQRFAAGDGWRADLCWRGEPIGSVWLHGFDGPGGSTEIGYWLSQDFQGRGLMTRAVAALCRHFFEGRSLARVSIGLDPRNERSLGIVKRLGLRPEAVLRRVLVDGEQGAADLALYGLLASEWRAAVEQRAERAPERTPDPDQGPLPVPRFCLEADAEDELYLGLFERDDTEALAALVAANEGHLRPWMPWVEGHGPAAQREFIEKRALPAFAAGDGAFEAGIWSYGRLVGAAGIHSVDSRSRSGMIGYWLDDRELGKGIVTRVVRAIIERSFNSRVLAGGPFERLEIAADVGNLRSRAVAERLGFTFEGVLRRQPFDGRRFIDMAIYSLLRSEYEAVAGGGARQEPGAYGDENSTVLMEESATVNGEESAMSSQVRNDSTSATDHRSEEDDRDRLEIQEREHDLDEALDDTFPASDPVSQTVPRRHDDDDDKDGGDEDNA